jgi:hypothetical protein
MPPPLDGNGDTETNDASSTRVRGQLDAPIVAVRMARVDGALPRAVAEEALAHGAADERSAVVAGRRLRGLLLHTQR